MLIACFSILEGTVDIQERIENSLTSLLELLKGVFSTCKGDLLEVKDGDVKTQPAILENLVFFVEVCVFTLLRAWLLLTLLHSIQVPAEGQSCHVDAGHQTQVFWKSSQPSLTAVFPQPVVSSSHWAHTHSHSGGQWPAGAQGPCPPKRCMESSHCKEPLGPTCWDVVWTLHLANGREVRWSLAEGEPGGRIIELHCWSRHRVLHEGQHIVPAASPGWLVPCHAHWLPSA